MKPIIPQPGSTTVASKAIQYARGMATSARAVVACHAPSTEGWQRPLGGNAAGIQNRLGGYRNRVFLASLRFASMLPLTLISNVAHPRGLDVGDGDGNLLGELIFNPLTFPWNHPYVTGGAIGGGTVLGFGGLIVGGVVAKKTWNWWHREVEPPKIHLTAAQEQAAQEVHDQLNSDVTRDSVPIDSDQVIIPPEASDPNHSVHGTFANSSIISGETQVLEDAADILADPDGQGVKSKRKDRSFQYEVIRQIAVGGMGTVQLIRKIGDSVIRKNSGPIVIKDGTLLALKTIRPELAEDEEFLLDFMREVVANDKYEHPNIAQQVKLLANPLGVVHEYLEKGDLRHLMNEKLQSGERIDLRVGLQIFIDIIEALVEVYDHGDVHRDLKPENILLTEVDGQLVAKVIDFGLVRSSKAVQAAPAKGTLTFMSPEQTRTSESGPEISNRSDIFALGLIIYELLTGEHALIDFDAVNYFPEDFRDDLTDADERKTAIARERQRRIIEYIRTADPFSPHRLRDDIPPELSRILLQCLEKNPDDRYQDPNILLRDVVAVMQGLPQEESLTEVDGDTTVLMKKADMVALRAAEDTNVFDEDGV